MENLNELFIKELNKLRETMDVEVYAKDKKWAKLWRFVDRVYAILTLGKVKDWSARYTITVGPYIFFRPGWSIDTATTADYVTLKHEIIHLKQYEDIGDGHSWAGFILFMLGYALVFLPVGLAYFRYKMERDAYVATYNAEKSLGISRDIEDFVKILTGPSYMWAWPFKKSVRKFFRDSCKN